MAISAQQYRIYAACCMEVDHLQARSVESHAEPVPAIEVGSSGARSGFLRRHAGPRTRRSKFTQLHTHSDSPAATPATARPHIGERLDRLIMMICWYATSKKALVQQRLIGSIMTRASVIGRSASCPRSIVFQTLFRPHVNGHDHLIGGANEAGSVSLATRGVKYFPFRQYAYPWRLLAAPRLRTVGVLLAAYKQKPGRMQRVRLQV